MGLQMEDSPQSAAIPPFASCTLGYLLRVLEPRPDCFGADGFRVRSGRLPFLGVVGGHGSVPVCKLKVVCTSHCQIVAHLVEACRIDGVTEQSPA